jgi:hypothetical protein
MSTSKQIWEHKLLLGSYIQHIQLSLTAEANLLAVGTHGDELFLWEEHTSTQTSYELRTFIIVGTGVLFDAPAGCRLKHIGTAIVPAYGVDYVWHVYEAKRY